MKKSLIIGEYAGSVHSESTVRPSAPQRIAAFDLDDTLIAPSVGGKWNRSASDWRWWHDTVPTKLRDLHAQGFRLILLSNQGAVNLKDDPKLLAKDSVSLMRFKSQLSVILDQLDLPITIYAATGQDEYRKPRTGMWKEMIEDHGLGASGSVDLGASFYVGDAAGRPKTSQRRKDHACSDR